MMVHTSQAQILKNCLVTTHVLYRHPEYPSIIMPFTWQTDDVVPEIPRVRKFLDYWKQNIEAKIHTVTIGYRPLTDAGGIRAGGILTLQ